MFLLIIPVQSSSIQNSVLSLKRRKCIVNYNQKYREFLVESGVHCYNDNGNVIYCDTGFVSVHAADDGEVTVRLPKNFTVRPLLGADFRQTKTDTVTLEMTKHDTVIF